MLIRLHRLNGDKIKIVNLAASIFDLLLSVRVLHVAVGAVDGDASVASPQVRADVVAVATNSWRLRALVDV